MDTSELAAREEIRELIARYTHLGDGGRIAELVELFAPDAQLDGHGQPYIGREEISGFFTAIVDGSTPGPARTFIRHYTSNVTIDMTSPTEASGASYWTVLSDDGFESSGRYRDTYRRSPDGSWRFATRKIRRDQ